MRCCRCASREIGEPSASAVGTVVGDVVLPRLAQKNVPRSVRSRSSATRRRRCSTTNMSCTPNGRVGHVFAGRRVEHGDVSFLNGNPPSAALSIVVEVPAPNREAWSRSDSAVTCRLPPCRATRLSDVVGLTPSLASMSRRWLYELSCAVAPAAEALGPRTVSSGRPPPASLSRAPARRARAALRSPSQRVRRGRREHVHLVDDVEIFPRLVAPDAEAHSLNLVSCIVFILSLLDAASSPTRSKNVPAATARQSSSTRRDGLPSGAEVEAIERGGQDAAGGGPAAAVWAGDR